MLVFVDESGDAGFKFGSGSSEFYTVAAVLFIDPAAARCCEQGIVAVRKRLGIAAELHFHGDSDRVRREIIAEIARHDLQVSTCTLDKRKFAGNQGNDDRPKASVYKDVMSMAIENLQLPPGAVKVVLDGSGNRAFNREFTAYLRREGRLGPGTTLRGVSVRRSHVDPLLQVADYCAGIANRVALGKPGAEAYLAMLTHRWVRRRTWPP